MDMTIGRTQEIKKLFVQSLLKTISEIDAEITQMEQKDQTIVVEDGFEQRDLLAVQVGVFLNATIKFFIQQGLTQQDIRLGLAASFVK